MVPQNSTKQSKTIDFYQIKAQLLVSTQTQLRST
jgi:hypothetical protein